MKTLYNLEVGDVVESLIGDKHTVLEVLTQSCLLSSSGEIEVAANWNTFKELEDRGYTVKPKEEEKWVPSLNEMYYYVSISTIVTHNSNYWNGNEYDNTQLALNLVFKTKEEAIARAEEILEKIK
jgi:hypothetical protein